MLIILVSRKQYTKADISSSACTYVILFVLDHKGDIFVGDVIICLLVVFVRN